MRIINKICESCGKSVTIHTFGDDTVCPECNQIIKVTIPKPKPIVKKTSKTKDK